MTRPAGNKHDQKRGNFAPLSESLVVSSGVGNIRVLLFSLAKGLPWWWQVYEAGIKHRKSCKQESSGCIFRLSLVVNNAVLKYGVKNGRFSLSSTHMTFELSTQIFRGNGSVETGSSSSLYFSLLPSLLLPPSSPSFFFPPLLFLPQKWTHSISRCFFF